MRAIASASLMIASALMAPSSAHAGAALTTPGLSLRQAVSGQWRTPAYVRRDRYRHPLRVLRFFGVRPNMTIIELEPGAGWWTEILAPYLRSKGHLIEAVPPLNAHSKMARQLRSRFDAKLSASPRLYSKVTLVNFAPPKLIRLPPSNSADMVLTFRNLHDWKISGGLRQVFTAVYRVLKPGGIFGIVAHRALPYVNPVESARELHRLPEDYVIQLGIESGFRLAGVSEVNANPKDPLNINVHRLPPDLGWGDTATQKKEYMKIGESDRMTLRFVKPAFTNQH